MRKISACAAALGIAVVTAASCDTTHPANVKNDAAPAASQPPAATGTAGTAAPDPAKPPSPAEPVERVEPKNPGTSAPAFRELTIPAGTALSVRLQSPIASDTSRPEQQVNG